MPALILLHGALGAASQFDPLRELLSPDLKSRALDLPQHGQNADQAAPHLSNYAQYLLDLLDREYPKPVDILGYSMGGYLALMMAAQRPERIGRVLTVATKFDWNPEDGRQQIAMLNAGVMEAKVPAYAAYLKGLHQVTDWKAIVGLTANILSDLVAHPPLQDTALQGIQVPCRIARGALDKMVSESESLRAAEQLPQADYLQLPDTPHPLEKMNPQVLANACHDFFTA